MKNKNIEIEVEDCKNCENLDRCIPMGGNMEFVIDCEKITVRI